MSIDHARSGRWSLLIGRRIDFMRGNHTHIRCTRVGMILVMELSSDSIFQKHGLRSTCTARQATHMLIPRIHNTYLICFTKTGCTLVDPFTTNVVLFDRTSRVLMFHPDKPSCSHESNDQRKRVHPARCDVRIIPSDRLCWHHMRFVRIIPRDRLRWHHMRFIPVNTRGCRCR